MQIASMIHCLTFIGYLEAALTHTKMHGIHINKTREWLVFRSFRHARLLIFVNRHLDFNLFASSLANRLHETGEPWMRVDGFVENESRLGKLVDRLEISLILLYLSNKFLVLTEVNVVFSTEHTYISGAD